MPRKTIERAKNADAFVVAKDGIIDPIYNVQPYWHMLALLPLLFQAASPALSMDVWKPAGAWHLDLTPSSCTIGRHLTSGGEELFIGFLLRPPSAALIVRASSDNILSGNKASISTAGGTNKATDLFFEGKRAPGDSTAMMPVEREDVARFASEDQLILETAAGKKMMDIRGSSAVAAAIEKCERDLLDDWHVDPAELRRPEHSARSVVSADQWMSDGDYPPAALESRAEGTVTILFRIDEGGRVNDCKVIESAGSEALDLASCRLWKDRGRFAPARNAAGQPIAMWGRRLVRWRLPR